MDTFRRSRDFQAEHIRNAVQHSERTIKTVRKALADETLPSSVSIVIVGSYARREANSCSDFDYFIFDSDHKDIKHTSVHDAVRNILTDCGIPFPSKGGVFGHGSFCPHKFTKNIGGERETNSSLTRRLLLLLESDSVAGEQNFLKLREEVVARYINEHMKEHGLARFMLNDLIKFYRTMCVDFEYKTVEANKDWAIRNIKLMFSRKLIYFSGLITVAQTAQRHWSDKRRIINELLSQPPIRRVEAVCGSAAENALRSYDVFLERIGDQGFRDRLRDISSDRETHTDEFRAIKNEAHHFSWALMRLIEQTFPPSHPIHQALLF